MNNLSYDKAFEELQEILQQIEEGDITLDTLSEKAKRAHVLIQHCQTKFKEVENDQQNMESYNNPELPIHKDLIKTIVSFLKQNKL